MPTDEMLVAGARVTQQSTGDEEDDTLRQHYLAMLAAAPSHQTKIQMVVLHDIPPDGSALRKLGRDWQNYLMKTNGRSVKKLCLRYQTKYKRAHMQSCLKYTE